MRKGCFMVLFPLLVLVLASAGYGWQGRMGGMGDPYGLVQDESDFLIHPAKIAKGEGVKFYGNYRFAYTDVSDWSYDLDRYTPAGLFSSYLHFNTSGDEYRNNALLGAAFPLGSGRMGVFFSYDRTRSDYDGMFNSFNSAYDMDEKVNNFSSRFIYGLPIDPLELGLELGVAYRDERKSWWIPTTQNDVWPSDYNQNLHYFMNPYDSRYWEIFWKAGLGRKFSNTSFDWTIRGGSIFSSKNKYEFSYGTGENVDIRGNVTGYRIGTDLWVKYLAKENLTLPFVVSVDYISKHREGDGIGMGAPTGDLGHWYTYKHQMTNFDGKIGGGVEKKINKGTLIGATLYYRYLQGREHQWFNNAFNMPPSGGYHYVYNFEDFPIHKEHRLEMNFTGEREISPDVTLRMGLSPFYGWVIAHDFKQSSAGSFTDDISLDGHVWGINASMGGSVKFSRFSLEPFVNGGISSFTVGGDGDTNNSAGTVTGHWNMDQKRAEWSIGGGFSVIF